MYRNFLQPHSLSNDLTAFLARIIPGSFLFYHGFLKILNYQAYLELFPDPIGIGSTASLILAIGAETIGGLFVTIGLFTRLSLIPIFITMTVAFFIAHSGDPFEMKELSLVYWLLSILSFVAGSGRYSIDYLIRNKVSGF